MLSLGSTHSAQRVDFGIPLCQGLHAGFWSGRHQLGVEEAGLPVAWLGAGGTLRLGRLAWLRSGSSHPNPNSSCPSRQAGCGGGPGSPWVGVLPFVFKQTNHEFKSGQRAAQSIKIAWGYGRCPKRAVVPLEPCASDEGGSRRVYVGTPYPEQHPTIPLRLSGLWSDTRVLYGPLVC